MLSHLVRLVRHILDAVEGLLDVKYWWRAELSGSGQASFRKTSRVSDPPSATTCTQKKAALSLIHI